MIPSIQNKKIAYSCLNWGMGHLTRSISILRKLSEQNKIYFLGNEEQISFLKKEDLPIIYLEFPNYRLSFSGKSFLAEMIFQSPRMIQDIQIEKKKLTELQIKHQFDYVISDNRFGFRLDGVHSIILTHQLQIKSPLFEKQGSKLNQIYLNKFDEIWVPDTSDSKLSGELSQVQLPTPTLFIGNISDLVFEKKEKIYDYFIIGSGPEPYRNNLIQHFLEKFKDSDKKIIFAGMEELPKITNPNIRLVKQMNRKELNDTILKSKTVITRAGYTSIMDLEKTKSNCILIPTPKQYEQLYLAEHLEGVFQFESAS